MSFANCRCGCPRRPHHLHSLGNLSFDDLSRARCAREVTLWPDDPMTNTLKLGERFICALYHFIQIRMFVVWNKHRQCLSADGKWNDGARFYLRLTIEPGLEIAGIDFQARRSDDRLFASAAKIDVALWAKLADVACVNPTLFISDRFAVALPVSRRHVFTADEDLAVLAQLHF